MELIEPTKIYFAPHLKPIKIRSNKWPDRNISIKDYQ